MTSFALIGFGFRAGTIRRVSAALGEPRCVGAVVRRIRPLPVPAFESVAECVRSARPDFLVTAVPRAANPVVIAEAVALGTPVLAETPPAPDLPGLRRLEELPGPRRLEGLDGLVQVAEQYPLMPTHAARLAVARSGLIGAPTQVQVSSTHQYHAVALIRALLGVGREPALVRATRTVAPLVDPQNRAGWTDDPRPRPAATTIATLDFGQGRSGLYDFTDNQSRNQLRFRRLLVRGTHGELRDDEVVRLAGPRTIVRAPLVRDQEGTVTLGAEVLYRAPFPGLRLNDDEIATATMLRAMAAWARGDGPAPYPLAEGIQDHRIALAVEEAAGSGATVLSSR
jgi:predicted dehydrogenase